MSRLQRVVPLPGGKNLRLGRHTLVMGIINCTPDSFSDGGLFASQEAAVRQGLELVAQGAEILDIGGESTRPGSQPVPLAEELERVVPVVSQLAQKTQAIISIDTRNAPVAAACIGAGAHIINDITAATHDPGMVALAAQTGAALILMHMLGTPQTMQANPVYGDVVAEVGVYLKERAQVAIAAGVPAEKIIVDPGIGFGKTLEHNLLLVRHLSSLGDLGYPILLGASRKAMIGKLTGRPVAAERLWGTIGAHVIGAALGADIVRVHDVAPVKEALAVSDAVMWAGEGL